MAERWRCLTRFYEVRGQMLELWVMVSDARMWCLTDPRTGAARDPGNFRPPLTAEERGAISQYAFDYHDS
jgi:hypothetical protein